MAEGKKKGLKKDFNGVFETAMVEGQWWKMNSNESFVPFTSFAVQSGGKIKFATGGTIGMVWEEFGAMDVFVDDPFLPFGVLVVDLGVEDPLIARARAARRVTRAFNDGELIGVPDSVGVGAKGVFEYSQVTGNMKPEEISRLRQLRKAGQVRKLFGS